MSRLISLNQVDWEDYDRQIDVGLSTIYQNHAFQLLKIEKSATSNKNKIHFDCNDEAAGQKIDLLLEQSEHNLYSLQNKQLLVRRRDVNDQIYINRKLKNKLKMRFNNKTALQKIEKRVNEDKEPLKIDSYRFGDVGKMITKQKSRNMDRIQNQSDRIRLSIKDRLQGFMLTKKHEQENRTNYKRKRYQTLNPRQIHESQKNVLSPACHSPVDIRSNRNNRISCINLAMVPLQLTAGQNSLREMNRSRQQISKYTQKQRFRNVAMEQKKRQSLYKSNLLRTCSPVEPQQTNKLIELDQGSKLKYIIQKYFGGKRKKSQQQNSFRANQKLQK